MDSRDPEAYNYLHISNRRGHPDIQEHTTTILISDKDPTNKEAYIQLLTKLVSDKDIQ